MAFKAGLDYIKFVVVLVYTLHFERVLVRTMRKDLLNNANYRFSTP